MTGPQGLPTVDVRTAYEQLQGEDRPLLVDVREPGEFSTERAEGAILMPLSTFALRFRDLPADRPLLLICAVGGRSAAAASHLIANGYRAVANVAGGTVSWERAGLPMRYGPLEPGEGELPAGD